MKKCLGCNILLSSDLFYKTKYNRCFSRCKKCNNESKRLRLNNQRAIQGRSRENAIRKQREAADLRYSEALNFKRENPLRSWIYICNKFKINYDSLKVHRRVRGIYLGSNFIQSRVWGQSRVWWKRKNNWDRLKAYQQSEKYKTKKKKSSRQYRINNADKISREMKIKCETLSDSYVKNQLHQRLGNYKIQIPNELVLAKREQLKLRRQIYERH